MSQAIVRANDRHLFHDLFERNGFAPGDRASPEQMLIYLADWMTSSKPSRRLKNAWARLELRPRVAEVAASELQEWADETGLVNGRTKGSVLAELSLLAAVVREFPHPRLSLGLGQARELPSALEGLKDSKDNVYTLANSQFGSFATLTPNPLGARARALGNNVRLDASNTGLRWRPRLVIPLAPSPSGPYWTEVQRVARNATYMLLVRNTHAIVEELHFILRNFSTGQASLATPRECVGVPEGWLLFRDVCINEASFEASNDLQVLVPLSDEVGFSMNGGMPLGRGIYHSDLPPNVLFASTSGPTSVNVLRPGPQGPAVVKHCGSAANYCEVGLADLGDGTFTLEGSAGAKLSECQVLLRSAARARPVQSQEGERLVYEGVFSGLPKRDIQSRVWVRGLEIECDDTSLAPFRSALGSRSPRSLGAGSDDDRTTELDDVVQDVVDSKSCSSRGHHYWICQYTPKKVSLSTPLHMACRDCQRSVLVGNRGKKQVNSNGKGKNASSAGSTLRTGPAPAPVAKALAEEASVNHDLLLDALGYLGQGPWGRFEALLAGQELAPWRAGEIARNMSALAHLDTRYRTGSHRVMDWSVPAPCIGFSSGEVAYLSGFRSKPLLRGIRDAVERAGGQYVETRVESGPGIVRLSNLAPWRLREALRGIQDALGRTPVVVEDASARLAMACLQLGGLASSLAPLSSGTGLRNLQRFDVETANWRMADAISGEGAYRFDHAGRTYLYRGADGREVAGPQQIVKLLAARAAGKRLHAYDAETSSFVSTRGAEPVGLLERALVAASGELPTTNEKGLTSYRGVTPEVAGAVLHVLYDKEISR